MLRAVAAALVCVAALGAVADARMHHPARGHRIQPAGALLDGGGSFSTSVTGAYSFRKLRSAYAGSAVRIRRASDNAELDVGFLGCTGFTGCPWDEAAAAAHCAATTCFIRTRYDQSGGTLHLIQATAANQPELVFNCKGSLPCMRTTLNTQSVNSATTVTPATGIVSLAAIGRRVGVGGTSICMPIRQNGGAGNRLTTAASLADAWQVTATGNVQRAAVDGTWHAANGVIAGASSVLNVDGAETTGTVTGAVTAAQTSEIGGTATTCEFGESMVWDNYQLTAGERAFLINNQRGFWGTP